jgi:hypothetical protein
MNSMPTPNMAALEKSYGRHAPIFARLHTDGPRLDRGAEFTFEDISYFQVWEDKRAVSPGLLAKNSGRTVEAVMASLAILEEAGLIVIRSVPWGKKRRTTVEVVETPTPSGPRWKRPPERPKSTPSVPTPRCGISMDDMTKWHGRHDHICGQMWLDMFAHAFDQGAMMLFFEISRLQVKGGHRTVTPEQIAEAWQTEIEVVEARLATLEHEGYVVIRQRPGGPTVEVVETSTLDWSMDFVACYDLGGAT